MDAQRGQTEDLSSTLTQKASEVWDTTREGFQSAASSMAGVAENTWDEVSSFIHRYPWACLAFSCGVGYLVSHALSGEHHSSGGWSYSPPYSRDYGRSSSWGPQGYGQTQNQGSTSSMTERAREAWNSAAQGASGMASSLASGTNQALDTVGQWSREYPLATPATGLLIGVCCGFLAGWGLTCQLSNSR